MEQRNQNIRSQEVQDILTRMPNRILVWSNSIILLLILGFLAGTWFIKYPDVISGETKITSINPIYKAVTFHSGMLDSIFVKENENVLPGQILATIKNNASYNDVLKVKNILDGFSINSDDLTYPFDTIQALSLGELNTSFALFESEFLDYRLRNSLQYYSRLNSHKLSISSLNMKLKLLHEQKELEIQNIALSKNDFERSKHLYEEGVIAANEFEMRKLDYQNKQKNVKNTDISINQLYQTLNEAKRASKADDITKELEKNNLYKSTIHALTKLKEDIRLWEETYLIKSEIGGTVSLIKAWNKNQMVSKGDHICSVIPTLTGGYIARLKAPETNSGKIKKGQIVNISLNNYPVDEYGYINGKVNAISTLPSDNGYYLVEIDIPDKLLTSYGIIIPFNLETSGTAKIITEDLRLCERFFYRLKGIIS